MSCDEIEVTERLENEQSESPMVCLAVVNGYSTYTQYIELTCTVFMLFIHKLHYIYKLFIYRIFVWIIRNFRFAGFGL